MDINFEVELSKVRKQTGSLSLVENFSLFSKEFQLNDELSLKYSLINGVLRFSTCKIDLSQWRILLLSLKQDSELKLNEIVLYDVEIDHQHVLDLTLYLRHIVYLPVLRLEYLYFNSSSDLDVSQSISSLVTSESGLLLDYLSLKANKFTPSCIVDNFIPALKSNLFIKALNLCGNDLPDSDVDELSKALKFNPSLTHLYYTPYTTETNLSIQLQPLFDLLTGLPYTSEDEALYKRLTKDQIDKNKIIKTLNKTRKKLNQEEIIEIPALPTKQTVNNTPIITNTTLNSLYIQHTNTSTIDTDILHIDELVMKHFPYDKGQNYDSDKDIKLQVNIQTGVYSNNSIETKPSEHQFGHVKLIYT